jgi:hypothetical protein
MRVAAVMWAINEMLRQPSRLLRVLLAVKLLGKRSLRKAVGIADEVHRLLGQCRSRKGPELPGVASIHTEDLGGFRIVDELDNSRDTARDLFGQQESMDKPSCSYCPLRITSSGELPGLVGQNRGQRMGCQVEVACTATSSQSRCR